MRYVFLTIMKTKGRAMRILAMANEETLAETRKARPTPARLTRHMVRAKHTKDSKAGFNPEKSDLYMSVGQQILCKTRTSISIQCVLLSADSSW